MLQRWWNGVLVALMVLVTGRWLGMRHHLRRLMGLVGRSGRRRAGLQGAVGHDNDALVGQTAVVEQPMAPGGQGQVALAGTVYLARNVGDNSLPAGITCRVTAIDHLTLWVNGDVAAS